MKSGFLQRFAEWTIGLRWYVVALLVLVTAVFASQIPKLKADFTPSDLFANFGDAREVAEEFRGTFGNTDNVILVLVEAPDVTTPQSLEFIYTLTQQAREVPGVVGAQSITSLPEPPAGVLDGEDPLLDEPVAEAGSFTDALFNFYDSVVGVALLGGEASDAKSSADAKDAEDASARFDPIVQGLPISAERAELVERVATMSPMIHGRLLAKDRSVAAIVASLDNDITQNKELKEVVEHFEQLLRDTAAPSVDIEASLGGLPYIRTSVVRNMSADQAVLLPAAIGVSLLILFLVFRWLPALLLPILGVGMSAVVLVGGMAIVGQSMDILNNIIPTLVVLIGISSTIHIINRYRDNIAQGRPKNGAASDAMSTMVLACFLTSFTTAIGFASLGVSKTEILRSFGLTAASGVMIAYVVVILFVPASLTFFRTPRVRKTSEEQGGFEDLIERATRGLLRFRWAILGVAFVSIVTAMALGLRTNVDSAVLDQVDPKDEVYRTTRLIEQKLGGIRPLEVYIQTEEPWGALQPDVIYTLAALTDYAQTHDGVLATLGYTVLLQETQRMLSGTSAADEEDLVDAQQLSALVRLMQKHPQNPLASWLRNEGKNARVQIMVEDMGARKTNELLDDLETEIAGLFGSMEGVDVRLTGDAYVGSRGLDAVITDLIGSLATAILIIFIVLSILFRSPRLGLISIPPALMPLAFTLCWMWIRGIPLNTATAIIFSIAIGMTVDGCIHFMTRFREEYRGDIALDEAIVAAARSTGKAIIFTCIALIVGFGVMLVSQFVPIRRFGELVAFTIFIMMLATMLVLPALLRVGYTQKERKRIARLSA